MPHDVELIILLAVGFGLALVFGYIAARLRLPPLIGYLVAGILISPNTPGDTARGRGLHALGLEFWLCPDLWFKSVLCQYRRASHSPG